MIPFAFDWRRPIEDEARRLADAVDAALTARSASQQPVRILAHSMGGLVARTMQLEKPETWKRMMARDGARLLMLGTPNGGSWAPMQVLSGDDTFGNALVAFGALFDNGGARKLMAGMPGFIQLQAGAARPGARPRPARAAGRSSPTTTWRALRERSIWHAEGAQRAIYEWGVPPQAVLDQAVALRRRLDAQAAALAADAPKMLLVVGHARVHAGRHRVRRRRPRVPRRARRRRRPRAAGERAAARRAHLEARRRARRAARRDASAFAAYLELLATRRDGAARRLRRAGAARRAARPRGAAPARGRRRGAGAQPAVARPQPSRAAVDAEPTCSASTARAAGDGARAGAAARALRVTVLNGDLKFVRQPLMVGHYRSLDADRHRSASSTGSSAAR